MCSCLSLDDRSMKLRGSREARSSAQDGQAPFLGHPGQVGEGSMLAGGAYVAAYEAGEMILRLESDLNPSSQLPREGVI